MKKIIVTLLLIVMTLPMHGFAANDEIRVKLDETYLTFDVAPVIINDRTMVPMRGIFEALDYDIDWTGETQTVTAIKGDTKISLTVGSATADKNGEKIALDAAPVMIENRTMVPIRFVAEASGSFVDWEQETMTVLIQSSVRVLTLTQPYEDADLYITYQKIAGLEYEFNDENLQEGSLGIVGAVDEDLMFLIVGTKDNNGFYAELDQLRKAKDDNMIKLFFYTAYLAYTDVVYEGAEPNVMTQINGWEEGNPTATYVIDCQVPNTGEKLRAVLSFIVAEGELYIVDFTTTLPVFEANEAVIMEMMDSVTVPAG